MPELSYLSTNTDTSTNDNNNYYDTSTNDYNNYDPSNNDYNNYFTIKVKDTQLDWNKVNTIIKLIVWLIIIILIKVR